MATLEDVLVPLYLLHRYHAWKLSRRLLAALIYTFALRGDVLTPTKPVPAAEQKRALDAVLATLTPTALALPDSLLKLIPPRPPDYPQNRELFRRRTAPAFDALSPAETAATHTIAFLFDPERAERLIEMHAQNPQVPGFGEVVDKIFASTWKAPHATGTNSEIQRVVNDVVLYDLMTLANDQSAAAQVRATASLKLNDLRDWLTKQITPGLDEGWHALHISTAPNKSGQYLFGDPKTFVIPRPTDATRWNAHRFRRGLGWRSEINSPASNNRRVTRRLTASIFQ